MTRSRHDRLSSIVARALELEPAERVGFVEEACAGDPDLRGDVEELLRHQGDLSSLLHTGAAGALSLEILDRAPEAVGPYAILERLGTGGMGVVYRARQTAPLDRIVALKLIRRGFETAQVLGRFESERQTLARMGHPNVARVYDAGVAEDGRPYFAMELIEGLPITEHADRHDLPVDERIGLFLAACEGVQHAHRKGVLHRDLKPSNILVSIEDGTPVPKIIDFGIAKALDRSSEDRRLLTEVETLIGTPEYMSPEQADPGAGGVDTRSDVYSLGAVLYELFSGQLAIDPESVRGASAEETRRRVRDVEPPRPSDRIRALGDRAREVAARRSTAPPALERRLRGELDWIVSKAMEKDPARRYGSPAELAEDLRRHLRHEPVQACPPSVAYRARKFLRRRRLAVSVAASIAAVAIVFGVTVASQARRLARERDRASRESAIATEVTRFLTEVFELGPGVPERVEVGPPVDVLGNRLDELGGGARVPPAIASRLDLALGDAYRRLGRLGQAESLIRKACAGLGESSAPDDPLVLDCRRSLAKVFELRGDFREAEAIFRDVVSRSARALGERHVDTLRAKSDLAFLLKAWARNDEAERLLDEAIDGFRRLLGPEHRETLVAESYRVGVVLEQRRYAELERPLADLRERMVRALGPRHGETLAATYNLALVELNLGRRDAGFAHLREAVEGGFSLGEPLTTDPHLRPHRSDPELAVLDALQGLNLEETWVQVLDATHRHEEAGRFSAAEEGFRSLVAATERLGRPDHPVVEAAEFGLIRAELRGERFEEADRRAERLIELRRRLRGGDDHLTAALIELRAACRAGLGDVSGALDNLSDASAIHGRRAPLPAPGAAFRGAMTGALVGDRDAACVALTRVSDEDYACAWWVELNPAFRSLHATREYEETVARLRSRMRPCPEER